MFGALTPWSGKPEDIMGVVVKDGVMHFYQMLPYVNDVDPHQTPVPLLDDISKVQFPDDSPEGLYEDLNHAVRKLACAKQKKVLFAMEAAGYEELLPPDGRPWKAVVVTKTEDGDILFFDLLDYVPPLQPAKTDN